MSDFRLVSPLRHLRPVALRHRRFAVLFFFLLTSIVLYPYAESSLFGYYAFRLLGGAIILLSVYAVTFRRGLILLVFALAVPALLQRLMVSPMQSGRFILLTRLLSLAFDMVVIAIIARRVYSDARPTSETIFGALSIYLLIGFTFASIYGLLASVQPNAFYLDPITNSHALPDRFDFIFYSLGTMTELGTPGITAVSREVRSVSLLQAILGILYLAVLISRIMSAYRSVSVTLEAATPSHNQPPAPPGSGRPFPQSPRPEENSFHHETSGTRATSARNQ